MKMTTKCDMRSSRTWYCLGPCCAFAAGRRLHPCRDSWRYARRLRRRRQAGLRPRSRQTARSGGRSATASNASNERTRSISKYPSTPAVEPPQLDGAQGKMAAGEDRRRELAENSNVPTARAARGSSFVAWRKRRRRNFLPRFAYFGAHAESARKALAVMRPDLGIDDARRPLAVERVQHLLGGDAAHVLARFAGDAGGVRARQHVVELQQRMLRRRRLLGPDVEAGARDALFLQSAATIASSSWMKPRAVVMKKACGCISANCFAPIMPRFSLVSGQLIET